MPSAPNPSNPKQKLLKDLEKQVAELQALRQPKTLRTVGRPLHGLAAVKHLSIFGQPGTAVTPSSQLTWVPPAHAVSSMLSNFTRPPPPQLLTQARKSGRDV
jgi:hypothetical protein